MQQTSVILCFQSCFSAGWIGSRLSMMTVMAPRRIGRITFVVQAKEWNIGSTHMTRSLSVKSNASRQDSTLKSRLCWVSITPLGRPVVPAV